MRYFQKMTMGVILLPCVYVNMWITAFMFVCFVLNLWIKFLFGLSMNTEPHKGILYNRLGVCLVFNNCFKTGLIDIYLPITKYEIEPV